MDVKVYFWNPYSPWQSGTCENTFGSLRQSLPKATDLSVNSEAELNAIADEMNIRPRATHDWRFPLEVYGEILAAHAQRATSTVQ